MGRSTGLCLRRGWGVDVGLSGLGLDLDLGLGKERVDLGLKR